MLPYKFIILQVRTYNFVYTNNYIIKETCWNNVFFRNEIMFFFLRKWSLYILCLDVSKTIFYVGTYMGVWELYPTSWKEIFFKEKKNTMFELLNRRNTM